jgi:hypothetical protein
MGPTTTQYSSTAIDGLLGGARVDSLTGADSIRLRRALDANGTTWQEARFSVQRWGPWTWTFPAEHPVGSFAFGTRTGSGGTTANFGTDTSNNRVTTTPSSSQMYHKGWAYGSRITGTNTPTTYLWSNTNGGGGALPFTDIYIRPRITSTSSAFTNIADGGTPGVTQPAVPRSLALDSPWGVTGIAGNTTTEGDVEVQAFAQSPDGKTMYVGGNFATVQQDAAGTGQANQPFLAAFDVATGQFIPTFQPQLNEQVHALATLSDGTVVAGGEFTQANGAPATGIVALDPTTGATKPGWKLSLTNTTTPSTPIVIHALTADGPWLYFGGSGFNTLTGGAKNTTAKAKNLGRASVTDGAPGTKWNPALNGTVTDVDTSPDSSHVYATGFFGKAGTTTANKAVSLLASTAAVDPAFTPTWSTTNKTYQRSVLAIGNRVYIGGSEHSLFGFDPATMNRVSGSILKQHGDVQVVRPGAPGIILAGCHCNNYSYQDAYTWPTLNNTWTRADSMNWVGAWDAQTGARIPQFVPTFDTRLGSGVWAIQTDSLGNTWVGGDINKVTTKTGANTWAGGFVRFDPADTTPPATPGNFHVVSSDATTVTLAWNNVTDPSGTSFQLLRDDRPILGTKATTVTVPKSGSNRFFVRTVDGGGNISASTSVLTVP